jgi:hypothetical protein
VSSVRRGLGVIAVAAAVATGAAGCGGSSSPKPDDPATAVPADAALYLDATVRPQGSTKAALTAALSKLLGTKDPGSYWISKLDQALGPDKLTYADDIEPWLGERAAVFFQTFGADPKGAVVVQTTDPKAALDALKKGVASASKTPHASTHRGTEIELAGSDAFATVGGLALGGTKAGVEAAIDAAKGSSLADSAAYSSSLSAAPSDRFLTVWADPARILDALVAEGRVTEAVAAQVRAETGPLLRSPLAAWGDAASDYFALEASFAQPPGSGGGASLIDDFPGDSWLAFGFHQSAEGAALGLRSTKTTAALGLRGSARFEHALAAAGIDARNLGRWVGDVSGFVRGGSLLDLGGALVIQSRDEGASARTLDQLRAAFERDIDVVTEPLGPGRTGFAVTPRGTPVQIVFTQRDGEVVVGLGQSSVGNALGSANTLSDSAAFKAAAGALGDGLTPSFYLDFQPIANLFELPGVLNDPRFEQIKPYLERLDYLIAGGGSSDGRVLLRLVLGVRAAGSGSGSFAAAGSPAFAAVRP